MGCFPASSHSLVAFWDEKLQDLSLQPLSHVRSESISSSTIPCAPRNTCTNTRLLLKAANCHPVKVPRFKSTFDLYNPNGSQAYPTATTPIIPRDVADTEGRTYVATMHFDRLGLKAGWRRAMWKKYRVLYVGSFVKYT
jgi:hypothetical protein